MTKSLMFDAPREGEFTQGTVFSCAYAEDYPDASVYGLVITARCDAAQDKTPIFSYIPVVSLHDWMLCDGANIAMETALRVSIDRNPDAKRRAARDMYKALLLYKFSDNEGGGVAETPRLTNFRKAWENRSEAYTLAAKQLQDLTESARAGSNPPNLSLCSSLVRT